ncbi:MAG: hypothetical protein CMI29_01525 [Opitutae bacterium]|nr:hypothetical protein [Opitutae bacterium]
MRVAQLAEAIPVPWSGNTLPLNLHAIAARCTNAYFAPKRFAAVQLAFNNSRCRVLVFHTGRLVGTGCSGPMAARLAILKAVRQLAVEADVHVYVRKFSVINQARPRNVHARVTTSAMRGLRHFSMFSASFFLRCQVGAVSIDAKLDCDAFASTHSATSHYDRASFVGARQRIAGHAPNAPRSLHPRASQASRGARAASRSAARSTLPEKPTCRGRRANATCSPPFLAWYRSCCATQTSQKCAHSCPSICACATGRGRSRATTRLSHRSRAQKSQRLQRARRRWTISLLPAVVGHLARCTRWRWRSSSRPATKSCSTSRGSEQAQSVTLQLVILPLPTWLWFLGEDAGRSLVEHASHKPDDRVPQGVWKEASRNGLERRERVRMRRRR